MRSNAGRAGAILQSSPSRQNAVCRRQLVSIPYGKRQFRLYRSADLFGYDQKRRCVTGIGEHRRVCVCVCSVCLSPLRWMNHSSEIRCVLNPTNSLSWEIQHSSGRRYRRRHKRTHGAYLQQVDLLHSCPSNPLRSIEHGTGSGVHRCNFLA